MFDEDDWFYDYHNDYIECAKLLKLACYQLDKNGLKIDDVGLQRWWDSRKEVFYNTLKIHIEKIERQKCDIISSKVFNTWTPEEKDLMKKYGHI